MCRCRSLDPKVRIALLFLAALLTTALFIATPWLPFSPWNKPMNRYSMIEVVLSPHSNPEPSTTSFVHILMQTLNLPLLKLPLRYASHFKMSESSTVTCKLCYNCKERTSGAPVVRFDRPEGGSHPLYRA